MPDARFMITAVVAVTGRASQRSVPPTDARAASQAESRRVVGQLRKPARERHGLILGERVSSVPRGATDITSGRAL
jgi:hypothetical protein